MIIRDIFNQQHFNRYKSWVEKQTNVILNEQLKGSETGNPKIERLANGSLKIIFKFESEIGSDESFVEVIIEKEDFEEIEKLCSFGII